MRIDKYKILDGEIQDMKFDLKYKIRPDGKIHESKCLSLKNTKSTSFGC